jgi:hypothetical protein
VVDAILRRNIDLCEQQEEPQRLRELMLDDWGLKQTEVFAEMVEL